MGCNSSKSAVQAIEIQNGKVRKASGKKIKVVSSDESLVDESNAIHVSGKSKSAKSRDSGIGEMDYNRNHNDDVITEESDPNLVEDIEKETRPKTPDLSLIGRQFESKSAGRERSKAILAELEAEGLITGPKIEKGGAAFEVRIGPSQHLEPLAPIRRPPRLERLNSEKKLPSKAELEEKMRQAEDRRKEKLQRRSRLASQLSRDQALANKLHSDNDKENLSDSIGIATNPLQTTLDHGQGEGTPRNCTIFDDNSLASNDSTNDFFKEVLPSNDSSFS